MPFRRFPNPGGPAYLNDFCPIFVKLHHLISFLFQIRNVVCRWGWTNPFACCWWPGVWIARLLWFYCGWRSVHHCFIQKQWSFLTHSLGGTSGLLLADRLSESGKQSVLVLEAGPDPSVAQKHQVPGGLGHLQGTSLEWNFVCEPQSGLNGRQIPYRRTYFWEFLRFSSW